MARRLTAGFALLGLLVLGAFGWARWARARRCEREIAESAQYARTEAEHWERAAERLRPIGAPSAAPDGASAARATEYRARAAALRQFAETVERSPARFAGARAQLPADEQRFFHPSDCEERD